MTENAPIILFVYNRPDHTVKTLKSLSENDMAGESLLYIFSDGPRSGKDRQKVADVRKIIEGANGFKDIVINKSDVNKGLGKSIIHGVSRVLDTHGKAIVLEDDLITSRLFLQFMNGCLDYYDDKKTVFSVSGHTPPLTRGLSSPVYFVPRISCWGWGTWKDRWEKIDWNISDYGEFIRNKKMIREFRRAGRKDKLDMLINQVEGNAESWGIRCDYNRFRLGDALTVYPKNTKVLNIGMDGSGSHKEKTGRYSAHFEKDDVWNFNAEIKETIEMTRKFDDFYKGSILSKLIILLRRLGVYDMLKSRFKN